MKIAIISMLCAFALAACQHTATYKPLDSGAHWKTTFPK